MKKSNPVSRSTYQKVVEKNKRLLKDIKLLTSNDPALLYKKIKCISKWREKFAEKDEFRDLWISLAKEFAKDNPEIGIKKDPEVIEVFFCADLMNGVPDQQCKQQCDYCKNLHPENQN